MGYKQQVQRSLDSSPGFLIKNPEAPHRTVLPNWDHETQIRIFPEPHPDGGFKCMREGSDDNNFSDAVWAEPVARSLGVKEQFTYIDRIPGITGKTPTSRLVEAITSLIEEKPRDVPESWIPWIKGGKGRAAKVQKTKTHVFWQSMEIMRKGKLLTNEAGQLQPQYPALVMGAVSLQMSFEKTGNRRTAGFQGPLPETIMGDGQAQRDQRDALYAQMFDLGDWCSIAHGRVMSIFQAPAAGDFTMNHYALNMVQELPLTAIAAQIRTMWRPWSQLLRYFTVEEHVQMLCRAFPPEAVDYAFGTTELRDLMPNTFKDAWKVYRAAQTTWTPGAQMPFQQQQLQSSGAPAPQQSAPMGPAFAAGQPMQQFAAPAQAPQVNTSAPSQQFTMPAPQQQAAPQPQFTMAPTGMPPTAAPAVTPPQQPAAQSFSGMAINFSGAPVEGGSEAPSEPIMQSQGFVNPSEFAQPFNAAAPAAAPAVAPQPTQPAQPAQGTPSGAAPVVDQVELARQLAALKGSRDQSAQGNS